MQLTLVITGLISVAGILKLVTLAPEAPSSRSKIWCSSAHILGMYVWTRDVLLERLETSMGLDDRHLIHPRTPQVRRTSR